MKEMQKYENAKIQKSKNAKVQKMQKYKNSRMQKYNNTKRKQRQRDIKNQMTKMQKYKHAKTQKYKNAHLNATLLPVVVADLPHPRLHRARSELDRALQTKNIFRFFGKTNWNLSPLFTSPAHQVYSQSTKPPCTCLLSALPARHQDDQRDQKDHASGGLGQDNHCHQDDQQDQHGHVNDELDQDL